MNNATSKLVTSFERASRKRSEKLFPQRLVLLPDHTSELQSFADRCAVGSFSPCSAQGMLVVLITSACTCWVLSTPWTSVFFFGCRYNVPALRDLYFCQVRGDRERWGLWGRVSDGAGLSAGRQRWVGDPQSVQINLIKNPSMFPGDVRSGVIISALSVSQSSMDSLWRGRIIEIPQLFW